MQSEALDVVDIEDCWNMTMFSHQWYCCKLPYIVLSHMKLASATGTVFGALYGVTFKLYHTYR